MMERLAFFMMVGCLLMPRQSYVCRGQVAQLLTNKPVHRPEDGRHNQCRFPSSRGPCLCLFAEQAGKI